MYRTTTPTKLTAAYGFSPIAETVAGNVRFVGSAVTGAADDASHGLSPDHPFATLDYAIGRAGVNGTIYVLPGHAENLGSATALTMDVAGQKVICLGSGSAKPTFSITAAAGTWNVTAANCTVENARIVGNFLNIVAAMTVTSGGAGLTLRDLETRDTSAVLGALIQIKIAAGTSDVTIVGYKHLTFAGGLTAPATNVILCSGAADRFSLVDSVIYAHTTAAPVALSAAASADVLLKGILLKNTETGAGLGIAAHNSTTGFAEDIAVVNLKNTVAGVTGTGLAVGPNVRYSNALGAYAALYAYSADT